MALISYVEELPYGFEGTIKELLDVLEKYKSDGDKNWIKTAINPHVYVVSATSLK